MITAGRTAGAEPARIGPNTIIQTVQALRERIGITATADLLRFAGLAAYCSELPTEMVPEQDVSMLYRALRSQLGANEARANAQLAGAKTARYVLAHRIPRIAQTILRILPDRVALRSVLSSIAKHTWTFAGSATVVTTIGPPAGISIAGCPACSDAVSTVPICDYYAASFAGLFRELVTPRATVVEVECSAMGAERCTFELRY